MNHVKVAFRNFLLFTLIVIVCLSSIHLPVTHAQFSKGLSIADSHPSKEPYILVGGQNGTWFQSNQWPRLYQIYLSNHSVTQLFPTPEQGAVWTGAWNGSQWLVSGYGAADPAANALNPFIYLYDGRNQIAVGTQYLREPQASWNGGDIFAASYNGTEWLLSGLGHTPFANDQRQTSNHMALGLFDGSNFTDLSSQVPNQWDAILYANAWNGHYWLIGGGFEGNEGVLFRYDGTSFIDLSEQLESVMPQFNSVQSIGWNGDYWLIGGVGFLAKYDGQSFRNLTPELTSVIGPQRILNYTQCCNAVNALAWNGISWMIGGGAPVAVPQPLAAWLVTYNGHKFTDLTPLLPSYIIRPTLKSSILTVTYTTDSWFLGGYANDSAILLSYANSAMTDFSYLVNDSMSTVNWIGGWPQTLAMPGTSQIIQSPLTQAGITVILVVPLLVRHRECWCGAVDFEPSSFVVHNCVCAHK